MKKLLIILLLLVSCNNQFKIDETFLPGLNNIEKKKEFSNFNYNSDLFAFSKEGNFLPELMKHTKKIKIGNEENSNLFFNIDPKINLPQQGYIIDIQKNIIEIIAKDHEGLFYSFVTLNQILYTSKYQKKNIRINYIKDYPALSYRSVHIDVKHHLEKKEYYFDLIDQLASIKINGIIIEFEDKLEWSERC